MSQKQLQREAREKDMKEVIKEQEIEDASGRRGDPTKYLMRMPGKGFEKLYDGEIPSEFKGKLLYVSAGVEGGVTIYSDKLEKEVFPRRLADEEIGIINTNRTNGKDEYFFFETLEIIGPPVEVEPSREMEMVANARKWGVKTMRMPGKGEEKTYLGTIPDKYKGKLMFVEDDKEDFGNIYDDDATDIIGYMDPDGQDADGTIKMKYYFGAALEQPSREQIKDAREERKKIKRKKKKKGKRKARDKEQKTFQELKKELQDSLKNDPDLPLQSLRPAGGWWGEFIPPESKPEQEIPKPKPNPEQAKAIKNLRDINDIAVKDTSSNLKGDVNELMSLYGIR